ncbi:hypothetical protein J6590_090592, partial [Homalodisca vitripennis]
QTLQSRVAGSSLHSATKSTSCAARRQQTAQAVVVRAVDTSQQTEDASDTSQQLAVQTDSNQIKIKFISKFANKHSTHNINEISPTWAIEACAW